MLLTLRILVGMRIAEKGMRLFLRREAAMARLFRFISLRCWWRDLVCCHVLISQLVYFSIQCGAEMLGVQDI